MGLFDWFRRKPKPQPNPVQAGDDLDEPRCHHYTLAHHALRHMALGDPLMFLGVLASPEGTRFLSDMLRRVSEHCRERENRPDFSVDDITVHTVQAGDFPCVVIEMPRPRATAEAHMVAAVLMTSLDNGPPTREEAQARYFTLERGMSIDDGQPYTVLCEWSDEAHMNYGAGPPAEVSAFVAAITDHLNQPGN